MGWSEEDFRRQINDGLERQGHAAAWRPQGVSIVVDRSRALRDHRRACEALHEANAGRRAHDLEPLPVPARPTWKICEQSNPPTERHVHRPHTTHRNPSVLQEMWRPPWGDVPRPARRVHYWLRDRLRPLSRDRVRMCGFALRAGAENVPIVVTDDGRARFCNLQHCGSVWECPGCMLSIKATRAEEVTKVVEKHGRARAVMLTLTLSHGWGDDLEKLRADLACAWSGFIRGAPYERIRQELGIVGFIRAVEVTHGKNGWHPHIHVVLLLDREVPEEEVITTKNGEAEQSEWMCPVRARIVARWQEMVTRYCGAKHRPDSVHGVSLSPVHRVNYLQKLGLELTDVGAHKRGKCGSRTPLEIAHDWAMSSPGDDNHARDAHLWRVYCQAMKGARQLTWSRGLKRKHGIIERSDLECAEAEDPGAGDCIIGSIPGAAWKHIRVLELETETGRRMSATSWILECAEHGGPEALRDALLHVLATTRKPRPEPDEGRDLRRYVRWVADLVRQDPVET